MIDRVASRHVQADDEFPTVVDLGSDLYRSHSRWLPNAGSIEDAPIIAATKPLTPPLPPERLSFIAQSPQLVALSHYDP